MSFDIYGQPLAPGHCEVHPVVAVPYPCPMCVVELDQQRVVFDAEEVWSGEPNPRVQDYDGQLDDFLASDAQAIHFEALDQSQWCVTVTMRDGQVWQLRFGAKNVNAKGYAFAERVD